MTRLNDNFRPLQRLWLHLSNFIPLQQNSFNLALLTVWHLTNVLRRLAGLLSVTSNTGTDSMT